MKKNPHVTNKEVYINLGFIYFGDGISEVTIILDNLIMIFYKIQSLE